MKALFLIIFFSTFILSQEDDNITIHTPDGQFRGATFKVFVNVDISQSQKPKLQLLPHGFTNTLLSCDEDNFCFEPYRIGRNHNMTITLDKITTNEKGTLLIFDIRKFEFNNLQAIRQVLPIITFNKIGSDSAATVQEVILIDNEEVYIANSFWVTAYTLLIVLAIMAFYFFISWRVKQKLKNILCGSHGRLSLSQTQIALWTVFIGAFVFAFGLIRLEVPAIPSSLIALMGISLATGSLMYVSSSSENKSSVADKDGNITTRQDEIAKKNNSFIPKKSWVNLISVFDKQVQGYRLSIAKAQMLFWTILSIFLFIVKSITSQVLWEVPWELVALMGISQSAYLFPSLKSAQQQKDAASTQPTVEQQTAETSKQ
ncbi:MAG: hypothetical protein PVH88_11695 [Ignavibacteria bacterium]